MARPGPNRRGYVYAVQEKSTTTRLEVRVPDNTCWQLGHGHRTFVLACEECTEHMYVCACFSFHPAQT